MKTSITLSLATTFVLAALGGCSAAQPTAPVAVNNDQTQLQPSGQTLLQPSAALVSNAVIADVGNGQRTPAAISFHINLATVKAYKLEASTAGVAAKTTDDLTNIRFYLIASDTGTPPTALAGNGFTYELTADNRTNGFVDVTFSNVAANASGKSYYVATAGFSSSTTTAANNITNLNAPITDSTEGNYFTSNSGGSPAGAIRVTPVTYAISGASTLGVPLKLLDAVSPVIDSNVNLTVGDEVTGAPSGSAN